MNRTTSNRRLLRLAAFLETLPHKRFNYECWVGDDWKGSPDLSCGTTGCALGWAATMPQFRRLGLGLYRDAHLRAIGVDGGYVATKTGAEGEMAGMEIFGVSEEESIYLFVPNSRPPYDQIERDSPRFDATPKQVAAHIRQFVKRRSKAEPVTAHKGNKP